MLSQTKSQTHRNKLLIKTAVWLSALILCAAPVFAQDNVVTAAEPVNAVQTAPVNDEPVIPVMNGQSIQTIGFRKDMPIKDALRMLAQMYQKNIVPSAKVDGIVTVTHLYDVTFDEALQAILGTHKYEVKGNFIKVYTNEEFMQDKSRFEYVTIPLHYINAAEARNLVLPLLSEFGQLGVTSPAQMDTVPGRGGDTLAIHDRLVVSDYPENIQKIRDVIAEVDVMPAQVLIEVTVMKAELNESLEFGIDWTNALKLPSGVEQIGGILTVNMSIDSISAQVRATEGVMDTTVLANPKIMALNKQAGKLIIGKQEGYKSAETLTDGGNSTQQVEFLESGTVLEFRPFIGRDGMIRLELRPEQSDGSISQDGLPNKTTTEVITNVMVKDGNTIVLGGLFKEETILDRKQVPFFGDIPFLGELFKDVVDSSKRTELIVLITPHIIHSPEQADGANRLEDVYRLVYNARKDIHGLSRVRFAEERYSRAVAQYNAGDYDAALAELSCPYAIAPRNHLDAIRLRERIFRQAQVGQADNLERVMLQNLEKEESGKWLRR